MAELISSASRERARRSYCDSRWRVPANETRRQFDLVGRLLRLRPGRDVVFDDGGQGVGEAGGGHTQARVSRSTARREGLRATHLYSANTGDFTGSATDSGGGVGHDPSGHATAARAGESGDATGPAYRSAAGATAASHCTGT